MIFMLGLLIVAMPSIDRKFALEAGSVNLGNTKKAQELINERLK